MLEFIKGLMVGVLVTLFTMFAIRWEKKTQKAHLLHTSVAQSRRLAVLTSVSQYKNESSRRPELGRSPSDAVKNS
jgi:hypothetical protein